MTVDPARVRVLAIGIERYRYGELWNLPGAADAALRFADWAIGLGVPAANVTIACTWTDDERRRQLEDTNEVVPTLDALREALKDLKDSGASMLLMYWCGHGVVDEHQRRALFTSDAEEGDAKRLDVDDLLRFLACERGPRAAEQLILVDACGNFAGDVGRGGDLTEHALPAGRPLAYVDQLTYFAAREGQVAGFTATERTSPFSACALGWLEEHAAAGLPVNGAHLVSHIDDAFARRAGDQRPVYRHRKIDGNETIVGSIPMSPRAQEATAASLLTPAQVSRLAARVLELLGELGESPAADVLRTSLSATDDVTSVHLEDAAVAWGEDRLRTALSHAAAAAASESDRIGIARARELIPRLERIAPLLTATSDITARQVRRAYGRALGTAATERPEHLEHALAIAAGLSGTGAASPLLRMAAALEHETGVRYPDDWYRLPADRLSALRASLAPDPDRATLVLDLSGPVDVTGWSWPAHVEARLQIPGGEWLRRSLTCDPSPEGVRTAVWSLIVWAQDHATDLLRLGLIATRQLLDEHPEAWLMRPDFLEPRPLWQLYPTVLHSAERLASGHLWARYCARLRVVERQVEDESPEILWFDLPSALRATPGASAACYGLRFAPGRFAQQDPHDPVLAVVIAGMPYLLWTDAAPPDRSALEQQLADILYTDFTALPDFLFQAREQPGGDSLGTVRVLWDDPAWLPKRPSLTGMEQA